MGKIIQLNLNQSQIVREARIGSDSFNLELFPLDVLRVDPTRHGADSIGHVIAADGFPYTVKSVGTRRELPLNEWLCYHLSEVCGIAVPSNKILRMPNGELVFGSRWAGGTYTQTGSLNTPDQLVRRLFAPQRLFALLTLDLFIQNLDRRIANLVFVTVDGATNVLAIDFSRALLHHPQPLLSINDIPGDCATLQFAKWAHGMVRPSLDECDRVLSTLDKVTSEHLSEWAKGAPEEWQQVTKLDALLSWWNSGKDKRLQDLRDALWNGTLF